MFDLNELRRAVLSQPAAYYPHQDVNRVLDQVLCTSLVYLEDANSFSCDGRFINGYIKLSAPMNMGRDAIVSEINRLLAADALPIAGDELLVDDVIAGQPDTLPDYQLVWLNYMTTNPACTDPENDVFERNLNLTIVL